MTIKLCECGCGRSTPLAKTTRAYYKKGEPLRRIMGHWRSCQGYPTQMVEREGLPVQIDIHRLRAEKALGKPLPAGVIVHHADGSKNPTAPLVICQDRAYHNLLHKRMRVKARGGDPNRDRICAGCQRVLPQTDFRRALTRPDGLQTHCRKCHNVMRLERKRRARQRSVA